MQILKFNEAQSLIRIIENLISVYHVCRLHHDIQVRLIASMSGLVEYTMSWTMTPFDREVHLCGKALEGVRRRDAEDMDKVGAQVWSEQEGFCWVNDGLVDVGIYCIVCAWFVNRGLKREGNFLDYAEGTLLLRYVNDGDS